MKRGFFLQRTRGEGTQNASQFKQQENVHARKVSRPSRLVLLSIALLLVASGCLSFLVLHRNETRAATLLPGQQIWSQGTSSLLYGANDASWQWSQQNMGNTPSIAAAVRTAGITVIRTPLHIGDAQARVAAIQAAGAKCLGILSEADAQQVVRQLGDSCDMYEFLNEPDNGGPSATAYASLWNTNIPLLRYINPHAIFIGPVVASPNTNYIQQFLTIVKKAGNVPDVVSYHMYPCTDTSVQGCPAHIADFVTAANQVRATVHTVLGTDIPLAVTEWNYSWKPNQTPQNDPYMATFTQQSLQAMAQAGISIANQFDIASGAGGGSLDMVRPQTGASTPQLQAMQQVIAQVRGTSLSATASVSPTSPPPSSTPTPPATGGSSSPSLVLAQQLVCQAGTIVQPQGTPGTPSAIPTAVSGTATVPSATPSPSSAGARGASSIHGCSLQQQVSPGQYLLTWWSLDPTVTTPMSLVLPSGSFQESAAGGTQEFSVAVGGSVQVSLVATSTGPLTENVALCQLTGLGTPTTGTPTVLPSSTVLSPA